MEFDRLPAWVVDSATWVLRASLLLVLLECVPGAALAQTTSTPAVPPAVATSGGVVAVPCSNLAPVAPTRDHPGRDMTIAGSIAVGLLYVVPMILSATDDDGFEPLFALPIAGPFILASQCDSSGLLGGLCPLSFLLLTVWALGQVASFAVLTVGIVRSATASDDDPRAASLELWPVIARDYEGIALHATF